MKNKGRADGRVSVTKVVNGKRKFFYGKTKAEAKRARKAYVDSRKRKAYDNGTSLSEWYDIWRTISASKVSEATLDNYCTIINKHIIPEFGDLSLCEIDFVDVRDYLSQKLADGLSPRTVNYIRTLFLQMLNQAVTDEVLSSNPLAKLKHFRQKKSEQVIIDGSEFSRLLNVITRNIQLKRMLEIGIRTGLRREELLALSWDDVNYNTCSLFIHRSVIKIRKEVKLINEVKRDSSIRTVQFPASMIPIFKEQRIALLHEKMVNSRFIDRNLVFWEDDGAIYNPAHFSKSVSWYKKKAGLPAKFRYYSLRHTHATMLLEEGVSIKVLQERLGHSSFLTTAGYLHSTQIAGKECADKIEKALSR